MPSRMINGGHALRLFKKHVTDPKVRALDMGSYDGAFLGQLKENGYSNLEGADSARHDSAFNVKIVDFSYENLPWDDNTFDAVTAWEVFEHLENPYFAMREVSRILKDGGIFMLSMPNPFHILSKWHFLIHGNLPRWNPSNGHIAIFTKNVFNKTFIKYFDLQERAFLAPEFFKKKKTGFLFLDKYLPESENFGHFVAYVLENKKLKT